MAKDHFYSLAQNAVWHLLIKMLFATTKSYLTYYLLPFTYYFPKNPAKLSKSEEVRGKK